MLVELDNTRYGKVSKNIRSIFNSPDGNLLVGDDRKFYEVSRDLKSMSELPQNRIRWVVRDTNNGITIWRTYENKIKVTKNNVIEDKNVMKDKNMVEENEQTENESSSWIMPNHAAGRCTLINGRIVVISSPKALRLGAEPDERYKSALSVYNRYGAFCKTLDLSEKFPRPAWLCSLKNDVILTGLRHVGRFHVQNNNTEPRWKRRLSSYASAVCLDNATGFIYVAYGDHGEQKIAILSPEDGESIPGTVNKLKCLLLLLLATNVHFITGWTVRRPQFGF